MLLSLESSESRMTRVAKNEIYFRRDVPTEEMAAAIGAVDHAAVLGVARDLFATSTVGVALLGDLGEHRIDSSILSLS
jgi:hypothetical protein